MSALDFSDFAAIKFGYGRHPRFAGPADADAMLANLEGKDVMAERFPGLGRAEALALYVEGRDTTRLARESGKEADAEARQVVRRKITARRKQHLAAEFARAVAAPDGFRERLVAFWADHFALRLQGATLKHYMCSHIEDAIRPQIAGDFADLLRAAILHPAMLLSLDQTRSIGPNSPAAQRNPGRGLNENLARELLELHTLGVNGRYAQTDVQELAEALTGLALAPEGHATFRTHWMEPGAETILGERYGEAGTDQQVEIARILGDLATHPDTARNLARKLAVHFIADVPPEPLVDAMAAAYEDSGGALTSLYRVMLTHPAAQESFGQKIKRPMTLIASALRALDVPAEAVAGLAAPEIDKQLLAPMARMGYRWQEPPGPDGWPEDVDHWISPQFLAERISWAMRGPQAWRETLPDPRVFVATALDGAAGEAIYFAAKAAETRRDGVGVILASPEFNRH